MSKELSFLTSTRWLKLLLGTVLFIVAAQGVLPMEIIEPILVFLGADVTVRTLDRNFGPKEV